MNRSGPRIEDEKESGTLSAKVRNATRAGADGTAEEVEQEARGGVWTGRCAAVVRECERAVKMRKRGRAAERMIAFDTVGICRSLLAAGAKTVRNGVRTGVCLGCSAFFLVSDEAERNRTDVRSERRESWRRTGSESRRGRTKRMMRPERHGTKTGRETADEGRKGIEAGPDLSGTCRAGGGRMNGSRGLPERTRRGRGCLTRFSALREIAYSEKFPMSSTNKKGLSKIC